MAIEIPKEFALKYQLEEVMTTFEERKEFLEKKLQARKIGDIEAQMARYRLARMQAVIATMRRVCEADKARVEPLKEGMVRKGGINPNPGDGMERPEPPAPMKPAAREIDQKTIDDSFDD